MRLCGGNDCGGAVSGGDYGGTRGELPGWVLSDTTDGIAAGVQKAFEQEGLAVAAGVGGWDLLEKELKAMRKVQSARGPRFETLGAHDDLVFALGLALFGVRMRRLPVEGEAVRRRSGIL